MLTISKKTRYGLRAMLYLARQDQLVSSTEIAQAEGIPHQFLEQIIGRLRQAQLVKSERGAQGGFTLALDKKQISMGQIVKLLEDEVQLADCLGDQLCCREAHCSAKTAWSQVQQQLIQTMNQISLADLLIKDKKRNKILVSAIEHQDHGQV